MKTIKYVSSRPSTITDVFDQMITYNLFDKLFNLFIFLIRGVKY